MPYETNEDQLRRLTSQALKAPDIVRGLDEANLEESDLCAEVLRLANEVWQEARDKISSYDEREQNVLTKEKEVQEQHLADRPVYPAYSERRLLNFLRPIGETMLIVSLLALIALILALLGAQFESSWKIALGKALTTSVALPVVGTMILSIALLRVVSLMERRENSKKAQRRAEEVAEEKRWEASLESKHAQSGVTELRKELTAAEQHVEQDTHGQDQ